MTLNLTRVMGLLGALFAAAVLAVPALPIAHAESEGSMTVPLADLGAPVNIEFFFPRNTISRDLTFAVPPGFTPTSLNATILLPVNLRAGNLTVTQQERRISRLELPVQDAARIAVALPGLLVAGSSVKVTLTMTVLAPEGFCLDMPISLADSSITFTGRGAAPDTVAAFLPPALRKLTVALPAQPSRAESNAAVQLAAIIARRYGSRAAEMTVVAMPDGKNQPSVPPAPMERLIIIREGPDKGLSLESGDGMPALIISGFGDDLANQARLLGDKSLPSAQSANAVAGPLPYDQKFVDDTATLDQLNTGAISAVDIWPKVGIRLDQTQFGHSVRDVRLQLIGSYTPLPDEFGGELLVSIADEIIDRWPADPAGVIDRQVAVPDRLLSRSMTIDVKVRTTGNLGGCTERPTMVLRIDGDTELQTSPADPPVPAGFRSLPQTMLPRLLVGIGPDAFGDTVRAAQIVTGLQRSSGVPLAPEVTGLDEAVNSGDPAILIAAQGWDSDAITLPVRSDDGRMTIDGVDMTGKATAIGLGPGIPLGSLQTVFDGERTLLIATSNGTAAQLDELLRWLGAERGRWGGLDGRAVISVPGAEPVTLPNADIDQMTTSESTQTQRAWRFWVAGAVVAVAAIGAALILFRTRRVRPR